MMVGDSAAAAAAPSTDGCTTSLSLLRTISGVMSVTSTGPPWVCAYRDSTIGPEAGDVSGDVDADDEDDDEEDEDEDEMELVVVVVLPEDSVATVVVVEITRGAGICAVDSRILSL